MKAETPGLKLRYGADQNKNMNSFKQHEINGFNFNIALVGRFSGHRNELVNETETFGFDIEITRPVWPFVYQYYLPCIAVVIASFLSFIVPLSAMPGRIALMVTQFLTLTNIFIHQMVRRRQFIVIHSFACFMVLLSFHI